MEATIDAKSSTIEPKSLPRRSWRHVAGRCRFLKHLGAFWELPEPQKSCSRHNAGSISAKIADRARGSKIEPNLVQNRSQKASDGVQMASKAVFNKAAISVPTFEPDSYDF